MRFYSEIENSLLSFYTEIIYICRRHNVSYRAEKFEEADINLFTTDIGILVRRKVNRKWFCVVKNKKIVYSIH